MLSLVIGFFVGIVLGSFSKATADRISKGETIGGRSYCESCKKALKWYDLFPVLSFIFLGGKCRYCKKKIPLEVFLAELAEGVLIALVFFFTVPKDFSWIYSLNLQSGLITLNLSFDCLVVVILTILFLIDFNTGFLPDEITIPAILLSVVYLISSSALKSWIFYQSFLKSPLAPYLAPPHTDYVYQHLYRIWEPALWTGGVSLVLSGLFLLIIILTRGRGMGGGDVKYILFLGLAVGFPAILVGVFLAFLVGSIIAIVLIFLGKKHFGQTVPFGPFLSIGAFIALLFGNQIITWYLNGFRF